MDSRRAALTIAATAGSSHLNDCRIIAAGRTGANRPHQVDFSTASRPSFTGRITGLMNSQLAIVLVLRCGSSRPSLTLRLEVVYGGRSAAPENRGFSDGREHVPLCGIHGLAYEPVNHEGNSAQYPTRTKDGHFSRAAGGRFASGVRLNFGQREQISEKSGIFRDLLPRPSLEPHKWFP
jgi:hypothetical protein